MTKSNSKDIPPWVTEEETPVDLITAIFGKSPEPVPAKSETESAQIMDFFPLKEARPNQTIVIEEIDKAFKSGKNIVILEAPVGSGKSAVAITHALAQGAEGAHIITPRKALQDQYYADFEEHVVLMKGRAAYPCTIDATAAAYSKIIRLISAGRVPPPTRDSMHCGDAPCKDNLPVFKDCTSDRDCPYVAAMQVAQTNPVVIHNLHSFIFQASFGGKFEPRGMLIVDEAHEIEGTVREFVTKKIKVSSVIKPEDVSDLKTKDDWFKFLSQSHLVPAETDRDRALKAQDPKYVSQNQEYLKKVAEICKEKEQAPGSPSISSSKFSVEVLPVMLSSGGSNQIATTFEFVPYDVGGAVNSMILNYGKKVLLMSGTIYDKDLFCKNLGIDPASAYFLRIGSSFPKQMRPIYALEKYQVNTSHANWNENFPVVVEKVRAIMKVFHDVKGLIHTPSYAASEQIRNAVNDPRLVTHTSFNFTEELENFFSAPGNGVFVSPICQQGTDFKDDRARFQIILRVPYGNTSSKFVQDKLENDFAWYNYQSLVVFGQQMGRINRSSSDFGATFLLDERFNKFLQRNAKKLPGWVKEAIIYR